MKEPESINETIFLAPTQKEAECLEQYHRHLLNIHVPWSTTNWFFSNHKYINVFPKEKNQYYCLFTLVFLKMLSFTRHTKFCRIFANSCLFFLLKSSQGSWCETLVNLIFQAISVNKLKHYVSWIIFLSTKTVHPFQLTLARKYPPISS